MNFLAAYGFVVLIGVALLFQTALLFGAPWGHLTMGGAHKGVLPISVRRVVVVSMLLLVFFALVVMTRASLIFPDVLGLARVLIWFVVGYCGLGVMLHIMTPSYWERVIWLPHVIGMLICSLRVALG